MRGKRKRGELTAEQREELRWEGANTASYLEASTISINQQSPSCSSLSQSLPPLPISVPQTPPPPQPLPPSASAPAPARPPAPPPQQYLLGNQLQIALGTCFHLSAEICTSLHCEEHEDENIFAQTTCPSRASCPAIMS
eukprot:763926-Hanusia_phi.AAC.3